MLNQKGLSKLRSAICAVGYMKKLIRDRPSIELTEDVQVLGTGFLVAPNTILTNRHVIQALATAGAPAQWTCVFFNDRLNKGRLSIVQDFIGFSIPPVKPVDSLISGPTDVGFLVPRVPFDSHVRDQCAVAAFASLDTLRVGRDVALCGFAGGNAFLKFEDFNFIKLGPVTHFGHVSALAPGDTLVESRDISNILTDISNGGGFSGSPLFIPETGEVVGLHYAGNQAYGLGLALPMDAQRLRDLMQYTSARLLGFSDPVQMTSMGDLEPSSRRLLQQFVASHSSTDHTKLLGAGGG